MESTETLVNKRRFYESLAARGIPHPRARFPEDRKEFERAADEIGYPALIKPEISTMFFKAFQRKSFVAHDREELRRVMEVLEPSQLSVMVQEIIPGGAACMHGCAGLRTPNACLHFCYRRIREFPEGVGCGSLLEGVPSFAGQTSLFEYLGSIRYTGIFDAEFKLDPRDGIFKMIEINARPWWQNLHPSVSGLNIIKAAFDYACGKETCPQGYRVGAKWVHLYNDFFAARIAHVRLFDWLESLKGEKAFDIWAGDDMRPMFAFLAQMATRKLSKLIR